jgi:hypothetical protein
MKVDLEKHILDIFSSLQIPVSFEVYDCKNDILPKWIERVQLTHEYLVCCEKTSKKKRLELFLGKTIFEIENHIYWFEGDQTLIVLLSEVENLVEPKEQMVDYLKTKTTLPAWLDDYIFMQLHAEYSPDFKRFDYNLNLNSEDNLKYLGTYFPRSYAESFCIFDNIFQNLNYQKTLSKNRSLNILSVGCGTGGDLIGLLTVIEKYCHKISEINIWALDGNSKALAILSKIMKIFKDHSSKRIKLYTIENVFNTILNIDLQDISEIKFDFILSFKMIGEIISAGKGSFDNSYHDFIMKFTPLLSNCGLCLLLDVTTKTEHNNIFNPILMNSQINQALLKLNDFRTLLPLPCNQYENSCSEQCFTQQIFHVSHTRKTNDKSKVSYRVLGRKNFIDIVIYEKEIAKYALKKDKLKITTFCPQSEGKIIIDGYKLKN